MKTPEVTDFDKHFIRVWITLFSILFLGSAYQLGAPIFLALFLGFGF
jgi:hypothetical protein